MNVDEPTPVEIDIADCIMATAPKITAAPISQFVALSLARKIMKMMLEDYGVSEWDLFTIRDGGKACDGWCRDDY